ncbi:MAG: cytochrome c3 family protein [Chloroflexi bacterium]|nr:cytochrome c3 family protein [Chloroflexota bacterium]
MKTRVLWLVLLPMIVATVGIVGSSAIAWTAENEAPGQPPGDNKGAALDCLMCHGQKGTTMRLGSGQEVPAYVDASAPAQSVHGDKLGCTDCHRDKAGYPHQSTGAATIREYVTAGTRLCTTCHQSAGEDYQASVHGQAVAGGNTDAASCADCHSEHAVKKAAELTYDFSTCAGCHVNVTESYKQSVHGKLVTSGKKDAATCVDCHTTSGTAHGLQKGSDPNSVAAPQNVPETCGRCHPKALETYDTTFHGKAMRLGVTQSAATCVDCHGAYGVQRVHAPEGPVDQAKIAQTCAKCHQGADENFAAGWMGHEEASTQWFPLVFITERFLFFLTTSAVAFGILHVELDLLRWFVSGRKKHDKQHDKKRDNKHHEGVNDDDDQG